MPALPADIAAAIRPANVEQWSNASILARYPSAKDGLAQPAEGFFDSDADGISAINQRAAWFGVERRRFAVTAHDLLWLDPASGIPLLQLIDSEQVLNAKAIPARIQISLENETTSYEAFA
jgi:hypothetical protein